MPLTVVPTSSATVAMDTFITELSSVIRNWPVASVSRTRVAPLALAVAGVAASAVPATEPSVAGSALESQFDPREPLVQAPEQRPRLLLLGRLERAHALRALALL